MYIARINNKGLTTFYIRESRLTNGGIYTANDLMPLGTDPTQFIKYPTDTSFYIDESVEDHLMEKGVPVSQTILETIFWPYVRPEVRNKYTYARSRQVPKADDITPACHFHMFDRRRLHYLKFGQMDQRRIHQLSEKMFQVLNRKSRDEIEQYFMLNETILKIQDRKKAMELHPDSGGSHGQFVELTNIYESMITNLKG